MSEVYAGDKILADDNNDLETRLAYHDAAVVDAVHLATTPFASGTFATETTLTAMTLSGNVVAGYMYEIFGQCMYYCSATDTETNIKVRRDTALTGQQVGEIRLARPWVTGFGTQVAWNIPWVADSTGAKTIYFGALRASGSGSVVLEGGWAGFVGIRLIGTTGTLRSV